MAEVKAIKKLRSWLKVAEMSQGGLADAIGVQRASMSQWLAGKHPPNIKAAAAIEKRTGGLVTMQDWTQS